MFGSILHNLFTEISDRNNLYDTHNSIIFSHEFQILFHFIIIITVVFIRKWVLYKRQIYRRRTVQCSDSTNIILQTCPTVKFPTFVLVPRILLIMRPNYKINNIFLSKKNIMFPFLKRFYIKMNKNID